MKSIKTKILSICLAILLVSLLIVSSIFSVLGTMGTYKTVQTVFEETTKATALSIGNEVVAQENVLKEIGTIKDLADSSTVLSEKKRIINSKLKEYNFVDLTITDKKGIDLNGVDVSSYDFFKEAMNGNTYTNSPIPTADGKSALMYVAAPIWKNGVYNSEVVGVVYATLNGDFLSNITNSIKIGKTGAVYMFNKYGNTIANQDYNQIINQQNNIELSNTDNGLVALAKLENAGLNGKSNFGEIKFGGISKLIYITPVDKTDGWVLGIYVEKTEFMDSTYSSINLCIIVCILITIITILLLLKFTNKLVKPIRDVEYVIKEISNGNYDVEIKNKSNDEIGNMASSLGVMVKSTKQFIETTASNLESISKGNLDVEIDNSYTGIYKRIVDSINNIVTELSEVINEIKVSSEQVSTGSEQVSVGSQSLSQGATEQASSIEELSATITEISDKVKLNAKNAEEANKLAKETGQEVMRGNTQMEEMTLAMSEISTTSNEISNIINTINNIAFQTNILALNAAVEASHAGAAGKGFAVVAEEVRNLSQKSAEAAKNTTELIEKSISAVENGTLIVNKTADSLSKIVEKTSSVTNMIKEIAKASEEQAEAISQVTLGVDQISTVIQTTSATAEESAATSEELNSQATVLSQLIEKFKVKSSNE